MVSDFYLSVSFITNVDPAFWSCVEAGCVATFMTGMVMVMMLMIAAINRLISYPPGDT